MVTTYRLLALTTGAFVIGCGVGVAALALWAWFETNGRYRGWR